MSETFNGAEGRRVVSIDTAEEIGEVKAFLVDPTVSRIESLHVAGKGSHAEVVPWSSVNAFGADAVVAEAGSVKEEVTAERQTEAVKGNIAMRGSRVLNSSGVEAGEVNDVTFDPDSGELTSVMTTSGEIDISRLRSLGSYALIVDAD